MRMNNISLLIIFVITFFNVPVMADVSINCPLSQAKRSISNNLPKGWWTTPMVNSLSETKVSQIGGRSALMCIYGSSGSIQRYAPEKHTCKALRRGFHCKTVAQIKPTLKPVPLKPVARPQTFSTGKLDVRQTYTFDLDRGEQGNNSNTDIWFQAETQSRLFFVPRNGAGISVGNRSNRGYAGCSRANFTTSRIALNRMPVGSYICVRTNENRISQFRVNAISKTVPVTISLGYTTWK